MAGWALGALALVVGAAATRTDLARRAIPNALTGAGAVGAVGLGVALDPSDQPGRVIAGLAAAGFLLAVALARPGGMGMGDVKLAGVIGLCLGPRAGALALCVAFASGGVYGLGVLIWHGARAYRTATLAFGPCLALGAAAGVAWTLL